MVGVDDSIGQTDYALGMVVGELRGINRVLQLLREDVKQQGADIKQL